MDHAMQGPLTFLGGLPVLLCLGCPGEFTHFASYVDNRTSTPYRPRETVASTEGERYATSTAHPYTPHLSAAPSVRVFESPEPRLDRRLSHPSAHPPLCPVNAGRRPPRPQMFCGADARGPSGAPLSGPDPDHA